MDQSKPIRMACIIGITLAFAGCASTKFVETWKNPSAAPVSRAKGQTIIACVAAGDEFIRRGGEEALAAELTKRGANGVPSYKVLLPGLKDEALAKAAFEKVGATAVVVMRPVGVDSEISAMTTVYAGPSYGTFWGGYWGYGWGNPYLAMSVQTNTIISVETLFYSLEQNKLIWTGRSETTNPTKVASFIKDLVVAAAWEMGRAKVFAK